MAVYIALGANLGDRRANLAEALRRLEGRFDKNGAGDSSSERVRGAPTLSTPVHVEAVSALYESQPQPPAPPPAYLNAACRVTTQLEPRALLDYLKRIERDMGRETTERWAPRPIDLDIALYDDRVIDEDGLVIPHPRLIQRNFVLHPLLDLDPELVHPATGKRLQDLLAGIGEDGLAQVAGVGWYI